MTEIERRAREVRARVDAAALAAGRDPASVTVVAATKTRTPEEIGQALACVDACGENRVQEFRDKTAAGAYGDRPVHFIGRLQTNKVKYLMGKCALIHSVDSLHLAVAVSEAAVRAGVVQDVLLEINFSGEESKGGVAPGEAEALLTACAGLPGIRVRGIMTVPPRGTPEEADRWFAVAEEQFHAWCGPWHLDVLSMGMSGDFEAAIARGATIVRPGSAIFGPRNYQ